MSTREKLRQILIEEDTIKRLTAECEDEDNLKECCKDCPSKDSGECCTCIVKEETEQAQIRSSMAILMWMGDCSTKTIKLHQGETEQLQRSGVPDTGCNYMIAEAECQLA